MTPVSLVVLGNSSNVLRAVASIMAQTRPAHEVLVIESHVHRLSSGTSQALARSGVRVVRGQGTPAAALRNAGVRASRGEWVALLDSDDRLAVSYLEEAGRLLDTGAPLITSQTRLSGDVTVGATGAVDLATALRSPMLVHESTLFRRDAWEAVAGFDESLEGDAVYDFWLRVLIRGPAGAVIDQPLYERCADRRRDAGRAGRDQPPSPASADAPHRRHQAAFNRELVGAIAGRDTVVQQLQQSYAAMFAQREACQQQLRQLDVQLSAIAARLRSRGRDRVEWGDLDRPRPFSPAAAAAGDDSIENHYVREFLRAHADDLRGDVLEIHAVEDCHSLAAVGSASRDCVVLRYAPPGRREVQELLGECVRILKPAAILLATFPLVGGAARDSRGAPASWLGTGAAARRLLETRFTPDRIQIHSYGNVLSNIAALYGLAAHAITDTELETHDPYFPVLIAARVQV